MIALRLVIDTNILVAAALKPRVCNEPSSSLLWRSRPTFTFRRKFSPNTKRSCHVRKSEFALLCVINYFNSFKTKRISLNLRAASKWLPIPMTIFSSSVPTQLVPTISLQAISVTFPAFGSKAKLFLRASFAILSPLTFFTLTVSEQACQSRCELLNEKRLRNLELFATGLALGTIAIARLTKSGECSRQMPGSNDKQKIIEHYDVLGPLYRSVWGEHLHHGYWIRGDESKEQAQLQLVEHLAKFANIQPNSNILDIGCGFGASTLYLAKEFHATVTGITISPVQIEMAKQAAKEKNLDATFLLMDAEAMDFQQQFDLLWSVESISHYQDRRKFFASAAKLLKPNGSFAITDWFRKDHLTTSETRAFINPIEKGMFVELQTMDDYQQYFTASGLHITHREVLNKNCSKTWDLTLEIIKDKKFWILAAKLGSDFVTYLKAFHAMRAGFASGNFVYGLFIASANPND